MTSDFNLLLNLETDPCNLLHILRTVLIDVSFFIRNVHLLLTCIHRSQVSFCCGVINWTVAPLCNRGQHWWSMAFEDSSILTCSFWSPFIPSIVHRGLQVCYQSWTMIESKGKGIRISEEAFQWATWDPWSLWSTLFTCLLPQSWSAIVLQSILSSFSTSSSCRVLCSSLGVVGLNGRVFLNWRASWSRTLAKCPSGFLKSLQSVASKVGSSTITANREPSIPRDRDNWIS